MASPRKRTISGSYRPASRRGRSAVAILALAAALAGAAALSAPPPASAQDEPAPGQPPVFGERIEVRLLSLRVRVVDDHGAPVLGLQPDDFVLEVGKREVPVEAVEWSAAGAEAIPGRAALPLPLRDRTRDLEAFPSAAAIPGRLVVFFVQADPDPSRLVGQLRVFNLLDKLLAGLARVDLLAVVSFDSHLKLRLDFSRDRLALEEALLAGIRRGPAPELDPGRYPSLARHWKDRVARRVASPERALEETAKLLERFPGEKIVLFLGHGFGRLSDGIVTQTDDYPAAQKALQRAEATVFALDVTDADFHSLEAGLLTVTQDTGGAYFKTHLFPEMSVNQLTRMTSGHYTLFFEPPERAGKRSKVEVAVRDGVGRVLAPRLELTLPRSR